ncbi:MAG: MarR family transcriptional regulator [Anaeromyxobacter sp.]|nr:MarR family transcriptional regulator [Anaeromyxobacter sp.]MBL0276430.1 MarR family transcriptional regulator [Anaeromyxobacter sp.]
MGERHLREVEGEPDVELQDLGEVLEFMQTLWAVDHELQSSSKRLEANTGVTGPQRLVIRIVGRFPGIAAGKVSEILHLHPSTLTGVLKRLEAHGMLERRADPADARRARLVLTAKGRAVDATRGGSVEAAVRRALGKVSPRAVAAAREVLEQLATELARTK